MSSPRNLGRFFKDAWEEAEAEGMVRQGIWKPDNGVRANTTHCIRTRYMDHLEAQGMRESVIDWMVGHSSKTTRGRSYTNPALHLQRRAAELIPRPSSEVIADARHTVATDPLWGHRRCE